MAEDEMVAMLLEAADGVIHDERDIAQARLAARWVREVAGWRVLPSCGFIHERNGMQFWVLTDQAHGPMLQVRARAAGAELWRTHATHRIAHLGHGLDVLAAEELIPAYLSTLGRRALEDYAEAMDRSASTFWEMAENSAGIIEGENYRWEMKIRSAVMHRAADQARAFPRSEVAVLLR